nr:N-acetylmuramoyl-L-alanine amidase [Frigidibacter sp. ROC022]
MHYTAMRSAAAALDRLCDPAFEVSSHWLVGRDGRLWSLVDEERRAWHAGAGQWGGRGDVNSRSVGIEIDNDGQAPFSAPAMATLERLLGQVMRRHGIPPEGVIAHSDLAPLRKSDPGPRFDWRRLARLGLAVWPDTAVQEAGTAPDAARFLALAARFGWPVEAGLGPVLTALRLRFRPRASGPLAAADMAIAADLARRFPVDRGSAPA